MSFVWRFRRFVTEFQYFNTWIPLLFTLLLSYTQHYLLQDISGDSEDNTACGKQSIEDIGVKMG